MQDSQNINPTNYFRCPLCAGNLLLGGDGYAICAGCSAKYEITDTGIPLIVADKEKLESELADRKKFREQWFEKNQIEFTHKGAWSNVFYYRLEYWKNKVASLLDKDSAILDYGCGDGANLLILKEMPHRILIGVDYNLLRLERAVQTIVPPDMVVLANILDNSIADEKFDLIFCSHVLEHIKGDSEVLKLFYNALKPGGYLFLGVPNEGCFMARLRDYILQPYILFTTDHVNFYTAKKLANKCANAGFATLELKSIGFFFPFTLIDKWLKKSANSNAKLSAFVEKKIRSQCDALYYIGEKR